MTYTPGEYVYYIGEETFSMIDYAARVNPSHGRGVTKFQVRRTLYGNLDLYLGDAMVFSGFDRQDLIREKDLTKVLRAIYGIPL